MEKESVDDNNMICIYSVYACQGQYTVLSITGPSYEATKLFFSASIIHRGLQDDVMVFTLHSYLLGHEQLVPVISAELRQIGRAHV